MAEITYTEAQAKELVEKAITEYEKEMNLKPLREQLDIELASLATAKEELEKSKAEFALEVDKFNSEKESYISKAEVDTRVGEAVKNAVALNERYHARVAKFSQANIKLDERGLDKLRNDDDESIEWLFSQIVSAMNTSKPAEKPDETPSQTATASVKTLPVGVTGEQTKVDKFDVIRKSLRKKLDATPVE
jgi:hypothetical protein